MGGVQKISGNIGALVGGLALDDFGDAQAVIRVQPVVRVSEWMNVAFGASYLAGGNFENSGKAGSVKVARRANLNLRIGGLADERRKPSDFEFESNDNKKFTVQEIQKKAGLGFDEMRILVATSD